MRAEGEPRRFEVMLEPQEKARKPGGGNGGRAARSHGAHRKPDKGRQTLLVASAGAAAVVIATIAVLLLLRSDPTVRQNAPSQPTPVSTATVTAPPPRPIPAAPSAAPPPPAATSAPVRETSPPPVRSAPPAAPRVVPTGGPTTVADEPEGEAPGAPTTRAPISVAPETRPAFPNQTPPTGGNGRGGLLGGGGLL